ncbi:MULTISPECIES: helix-turn-helix domain-containing protein [Corynebacterium]|nr:MULTISPECIES: helix-turn-helix transcriptional regulator [Corynebacterium]AJE66712.1 XRE family transcriptional regulator [Corynebacterium glutamicum]AKF26728.1 XRE family transcriptional regulator [[Brevibacterium] flavum]ALP49447.1 XRE family transcriptional regulator [Corynebacterium glutamicum]ALZ99462.1 XRE family transcriptional regulator [Corynebacterium glutamicum]ANE07546.1 XRE family transcriptional regulator [Corynebacterium glutamicum]
MSEKRWSSYGHAFASRLKKLRTLRGFSQEELADLSGVSRNTISNYERNENNKGNAVDPQLSNIYRLAQALDVPPIALMPAGSVPVAKICVDETAAIDVRWPSEKDPLLFDADLRLTRNREQPGN